MPSEWYYTVGGVKHGPVSGEELRALARSGRLRPADLVWKAGMPAWVPAGKVKGLIPEGAPEPPVPPPLPLPGPPPAAVHPAPEPLVFESPPDRQISAATRPRRKGGIRPLTLLVVGGVVLSGCVACAVIGLAVGPQGGAGAPGGGKVGRAKGHVDMTVDEFRKSHYDSGHSLRVWKPRTKFYAEYGEPLRVVDIGDSTFLVYQCRDGAVRLECVRAEFNHDDTIRPIDFARQ